MKILGVDFGTKRIGIALSDDGGTLAFPHSVVENNADAIEKIRNIIKENSISEIVIGIPTDQDGGDTTATDKAKDFAKSLEQFNLPVHTEDERFSSHNIFGNFINKSIFSARKEKLQKPEKIDAQAAALILQRYLDSRKLKQ